MARARRPGKTARMHVIHHANLKGRDLDAGVDGQHFCAVGPACGVHDFQVWVHTLPPGARTPLQQHAGAFAALVLSGSGKLLIDGGPTRFQSPCTLVVPPRTDFRIANNAGVPLRVVTVFTPGPAGG